MKLVSCSRRLLRRQPLEPLSEMTLVTGYGIAGDAYAHAHASRQVLLASTSAYETLQIPPGTLKENLLVDFDIDRCSSGDALEIGETLLRLSFVCEPCSRLDLARPGLMREAIGWRGVVGRVIEGGVIRPGDEVHIRKGVFAEQRSHVRQRIVEVMKAMPSDQVASITTMLQVAGAPSSYARAMGEILRSLDVPHPERILNETDMQNSDRPRWDPCSYFADGSACASQQSFSNLLRPVR